MAAIENQTGESLELSFGGLGLTVTFTSKGGRAVSKVFPWSVVPRFMSRLMDEFKDNIADWADQETKEYSDATH